MINTLMIVAAYLIVGGLAANALLIMSLVSVAMGGDGSHVSPDRRLPQDSDSRLFTLLFVVGGLVGLGAAFVSGCVFDVFFLAATGGVGFVAGLPVAFTRVTKLNDLYLTRAMESLEQGLYKEAFEDASEVARSSERLRGQANEIVEAAQELRRNQLISDSTTGSEPRYAATHESV